MNRTKSDKLLVLTQDLAYGGGVAALNDFLKDFLIRRKVDTTFSYLAKDKALSLSKLKRLHLTSDHELITANPSTMKLWSFPYLEPFSYFLPKQFLKKTLPQYDHLFAVVGYASQAYPLFLTKKPYCLWLATTFTSQTSTQQTGFNSQKEALLFKINNFLSPITKSQEKKVLRHAQHILAISNATKNEAVKLGVNPSKISIISPAVNTHELVYDSRKRKNYIFYAGRLDDPRKNIPLLIKSFHLFHKKHPNFQLLLAGGGSGELEKLVDQLNIASSVKFLGKISREDLISHYQNARVFVSTASQEGFGISVAEAMSCGTPVISTKSGGVEDIIDNDTGILVNASERNISTALHTLVTDQKLWNKLSKNGSQKIEQNFSVGVVTKSFDRFFHQHYPGLLN